METISSLLYIPNNVPQYEFLVEQVLVPAFDIPESKMVCELVGLNYPWYKEFYDYFHSHIIPLNLSTNQSKTFIHKASRYAIIDDTFYQ